MNDWDRDNLNFLLNASKDDLEDWWQHATPDDIEYATRLFQIARNEIELQLIDLLDQTEVEDFTEANAVLAKFKLQ